MVVWKEEEKPYNSSQRPAKQLHALTPVSLRYCLSPSFLLQALHLWHCSILVTAHTSVLLMKVWIRFEYCSPCVKVWDLHNFQHSSRDVTKPIALSLVDNITKYFVFLIVCKTIENWTHRQNSTKQWPYHQWKLVQDFFLWYKRIISLSRQGFYNTVILFTILLLLIFLLLFFLWDWFQFLHVLLDKLFLFFQQCNLENEHFKSAPNLIFHLNIILVHAKSLITSHITNVGMMTFAVSIFKTDKPLTVLN